MFLYRRYATFYLMIYTHVYTVLCIFLYLVIVIHVHKSVCRSTNVMEKNQHIDISGVKLEKLDAETVKL